MFLISQMQFNDNRLLDKKKKILKYRNTQSEITYK